MTKIHDDKTIEVQCSIINFINLSKEIGLENFIEAIIGDHFAYEKNKNELFNNVVFVFEDIN